MKIGIDARMYGPEVGGGGLGRYVKELLQNLQELDDHNRYVVFLNRAGFDAFQSKSPRFEKRLADVRWYTLAEQTRMPRLIDREGLDLIHYPHWNVPIFAKTPFLVTIHDLILLDETRSAVRATTLPRPLYLLKRAGYHVVLRHALMKSRAVIAVSEFTKARIHSRFPQVPENKVVRVYEGGASALAAEADDCAFVPKAPYILYVGNAFPHKNLESLLHAFSFFHKAHPDVKLVLAGKSSVFYERLKKEMEEIDVPESAVVFPGFVPEERLPLLYKHATLYVFPSHHEGFGLPPLEAMAHGVPVAASERSSLPEILGNAALYFDPDDLEEMVRVMETALSDDSLRRELTEKGFEQVKRYSWNGMAKKTLELYESYAP